MSLQYLGSLDCDHVVLKNDELTVAELQSLEPRAILLSPGPGKVYTQSHRPGLVEVKCFIAEIMAAAPKYHLGQGLVAQRNTIQ